MSVVRGISESVRGSRARVALCAGVLTLVFMTAAGTGVASAQAAFSARGSVEQVYVTGLAPGAQMSLLERRRAGRSPRSRPNSLGGLLFRDVPPGAGYRVRLPREAEARGR